MKRYFKMYRKYSAAKKEAHGRPIIEIGPVFLVGNWEPLDSIRILRGDGRGTSTVTLRSLDRLGNGNRATAEKEIYLGDRTFKDV